MNHPQEVITHYYNSVDNNCLHLDWKHDTMGIKCNHYSLSILCSHMLQVNMVNKSHQFLFIQIIDMLEKCMNFFLGRVSNSSHMFHKPHHFSLFVCSHMLQVNMVNKSHQFLFIQIEDMLEKCMKFFLDQVSSSSHMFHKLHHFSLFVSDHIVHFHMIFYRMKVSDKLGSWCNCLQYLKSTNYHSYQQYIELNLPLEN